MNPTYLQVSRAITEGQNLKFDVLPYEPKLGTTQRSSLDAYAGQDITAVVIQQPNFFGLLEDVDAITDWAHANNALVIAVVNPLVARDSKTTRASGERKASTSSSATASLSACRCPQAVRTSAS